MSTENTETKRLLPIDGRPAEALVRLIESSVHVHRRFQFFIWTQSCLNALVPHAMIVCGAYQRPRRDVVFDALYSVPVTPTLIAALTDSGSALTRSIQGAWMNNHGRALRLPLRSLDGEATGVECDRLFEMGFREVLVHGVSRPQRPSELETLFTLWSTESRPDAQPQLYLDLLIPYLHSTYQRVVNTERRLANSKPVLPGTPRSDDARAIITERERQILSWVREGKSNHEIGTQLEISALTVKNHVQKILRKLDAANRAQAVAKAMMLNLLHSPADERSRWEAPTA